ncbi:unnamed protein product [Bemisia tabaci]|uniref:Uncharacterized protein n=1 Tax=Bemisia tabaci TaxID=7038 RepID=A0A9P0F6R9_BEMTA|nr:unnamed protein product [Bemisia tabaci]
MEEFNSIHKLVNNDTISPTEHNKNKTYPLLKLERTDSKYGDATIASILIKNVVRKVFLPKVYTSDLSDEAIEKINDEAYNLKYLGPEGKSHKYVLTTKPKTKKTSQKKVESDEEEEKPKKKKKVSKKEELDEDDEKEKKRKKNTKKPVQKKNQNL